MQTAELEQRWYQLFPQRERTTLTKEWECILSRYSEAHRHYHTLRHIDACLHWLDQVREYLTDPRAVELALWFHDLVYNPRRHDNENISAEYAVATLSLLRESKTSRDAVRELILVTRHSSDPVSPDQCWMVDIDLAILGAPAEQYDAYVQRVRQEYMHAPDALWRAGRKVVLEGFLQTGSVYNTDYFRQRLDAAARTNLQRELALL